METEISPCDYTVDTVQWVKPSTPTILGNVECLQVPPTDLSFACIQQAIVFPGPLNKAKFATSFEHALSLFPHAAGRLRCTDGRWIIAFTNSSVPIIFGTSQLELTEELLQGPHPHVSQPTEMGFEPATSEEPLIKAVVTEWPKTGETSFGFSFSHVLGDGACIIHFVLTMSRFYNDRPPYPPPSFEKFLNPEEPVLERTLIQEMLPEVPHLAIDYAPDVFHQMYNEMMETTAFTKVTFTAEQLAALQTTAQAQAGSNKLTRQDAVVAYIATVLNRISPTPIRQIVNILDYRGALGVPGKYNPPPRWAVGNVILQKFSEKLPEDRNTSMGTYAAVMRQNVLAARDPDFIRRYVAIAKELRLRSTATNRIQWWWTFEDSIGVNNLAKHEFKEMSFGYLGKERFFLFGDWERYLRILPANPVRSPDGGWNSNEGGVDVLFRLRKDLRSAFLRTKDEDMQGIGERLGKL